MPQRNESSPVWVATLDCWNCEDPNIFRRKAETRQNNKTTNRAWQVFSASDTQRLCCVQQMRPRSPKLRVYGSSSWIHRNHRQCCNNNPTEGFLNLRTTCYIYKWRTTKRSQIISNIKIRNGNKWTGAFLNKSK